MNEIKKMENLPESKPQGIQTVLQIPLKITVEKDSFLHIGGSPSPLTEGTGIFSRGKTSNTCIQF